MRNTTFRYAIAAVFVAVALPGLVGFRHDGALSPEIKKSTVDSLSKDMKDFYFFQDLAAKVDDDLAAREGKGEYDSIQTGDDMAKKLTEDMRAICHDAHLRVGYSEEVLPVRKENDQPSPDEIKAEHRQDLLLNGGFESVQRLPGNIGYVEVRGFIQKEDFVKPAQAAMAFLQNTDALIIDLRRNGGGDPESVQYLCSYLFNDRVHLNDISIRGQGKKEFWTVKVPGQKMPDKPVYVLTSKRTASGAEECAYDLQSLHRATIVGESTWGGANPGGRVRLNDHFYAFIPEGQAMNPYTHKNWEGTGVQPDVAVAAPDALKVAQVSAIKELLAKATEQDDKDRFGRALKDLEAAP
jgi:hypothetical protein